MDTSGAEATLWVVAAIGAGTLAATARPLWTEARSLRWHPATLALAVGAPLAVALLLPPSAYHFSGHEGSYGELLDGARPWGDLASYRIMPTPASLAAALGTALPPSLARGAWLLLNRAALALVILAGAGAAARLGGARHQRAAGLLAALGLLATAPLIGWSATAFAIVPALACGLVALFLGASGRRGAALAWGALAIGARLETAPLLLAGIAASLPRSGSTRTHRWPTLLAGATALAGVLASLAARPEPLPLETAEIQWAVVVENARVLGLGGAWMSLWALGLIGALLWLERTRWRLWSPLLLGLLAAFLQLIPLLDLGARHLLPASALAAVLAAGLGSARPRWALLALVPLLLLGGRGAWELRHRYAAGPDAHLPAWVAAADRGPSRGLADAIDQDCYVVLPGEPEAALEAARTGDVHEIHNAALELADGHCVQWAVDAEAAFLGDCAGERFDRARRVLRLRPEGWIERPDGARWMLWRAPEATGGSQSPVD